MKSTTTEATKSSTRWRVLNEGLGFHPKEESLDRSPIEPPLDQKLDSLIQVVHHHGKVHTDNTQADLLSTHAQVHHQGKIHPNNTKAPHSTHLESHPPHTKQSTRPHAPQNTASRQATPLHSLVSRPHAAHTSLLKPTPMQPAKSPLTKTAATGHLHPRPSTKISTDQPPHPTPSHKTPTTQPPHLTQKHKKTLFQASAKKGLDFKASPTTTKKPALQKIPFSLKAFFVDVLVVLSINLLFVSAGVFLTQVDLINLLLHSPSSLSAQLAIGILALVALEIYVLLMRSFWGYTLGEWAWGVQLGTTTQIKKLWYPLLVLWRSILVLATGFVVLPILSLICRRDVLYYLTGLHLHKKINT